MRTLSFVLAFAAGIVVGGIDGEKAAAQKGRDLQSFDAFSGIVDRAARSKALFLEAAKVLTDPRCMNCHPAGDHPLQGADHHIHQPTAFRGEAACPAWYARPAIATATLHCRLARRAMRVSPDIPVGGWRHLRWLGKANQSAKSVASSKTRCAMEVEASPYCKSTSQRTIW